MCHMTPLPHTPTQEANSGYRGNEAGPPMGTGSQTTIYCSKPDVVRNKQNV